MVERNKVSVKGPLGELHKKLNLDRLESKIEDKKATFTIENPSTPEKARCGTAAAYVKKMIKGVMDGYKYKMKVVYAHFPINVSVEGKRVVIKNFFGEKTPRYADIFGSTKVEIKGQEITVNGIDNEEVGQTCANIEKATKIRNKDSRVFQDGIYLTSYGEEK